MTVRSQHRDDKTPLERAWYGRLRCSHSPQEDTDVLPSPCPRMDPRHPDPPAPVDPAPSHGLGAGEPGHGPGPLRCVDGRQCVFGDMAEAPRAAWAPAVA